MESLIFYFKYLIFFGAILIFPLTYTGIVKLFDLKRNRLMDSIHAITWIIGLVVAFFVFQIGTDDVMNFLNPPSPCDTNPESNSCMEYINQDPYEDAQPGGYRD